VPAYLLDREHETQVNKRTSIGGQLYVCGGH
jgi:hypothetical protein